MKTWRYLVTSISGYDIGLSGWAISSCVVTPHQKKTTTLDTGLMISRECTMYSLTVPHKHIPARRLIKTNHPTLEKKVWWYPPNPLRTCQRSEGIFELRLNQRQKHLDVGFFGVVGDSVIFALKRGNFFIRFCIATWQIHEEAKPFRGLFLFMALTEEWVPINPPATSPTRRLFPWGGVWQTLHHPWSWVFVLPWGRPKWMYWWKTTHLVV